MFGGNLILNSLLALSSAVAVSAGPSMHPLHKRALMKREAAAKGGLTDADILQLYVACHRCNENEHLTCLSALTLEHLENNFYKQGFEKFPKEDFLALGLNEKNVEALKAVGKTEAIHVDTLLGALASSGVKPVEPCEYQFGFTDAATMVATARILEAVGVSA